MLVLMKPIMTYDPDGCDKMKTATRRINSLLENVFTDVTRHDEPSVTVSWYSLLQLCL